MNPDENENTIMLTGLLPQFFADYPKGCVLGFYIFMLPISVLFMSLVLSIPQFWRRESLQEWIRYLLHVLWILALGFVILSGILSLPDPLASTPYFGMGMIIISMIVSWFSVRALKTIRDIINPNSGLAELTFWYFTINLIFILAAINISHKTLFILVPAITVLGLFHVPLYLSHRFIIMKRYCRFFIIFLSLLLLVFILFSLAKTALNSRRSAWENRVKLTLRSLGSAELSFFNSNKEHRYGTFDELVKEGLITEGYTRSNLIDNYSLCVFDVSPIVVPERWKSHPDMTFTIIALPRAGRNLRTFAIGTDQIMKVWIGEPSEFDLEKVDPHNSKHWKPLR